jgi:hypothetical protein
MSMLVTMVSSSMHVLLIPNLTVCYVQANEVEQVLGRMNLP